MGLKLTKLGQKSVFENKLHMSIYVSCGLLGAGDVVCQGCEMLVNKNLHQKFNRNRTESMFLIGLAMAPFGQIWYFRLMEKLIPGAPSMEIALKKVLADQIVAGPVFISFFLFGKELLEGRGGSVGITELKDKFLPLYMASWCVWPPAQLLLFKFLPADRRFRYLAGVTFCWNFFLSWYTHKDLPLYIGKEKKK